MCGPRSCCFIYSFMYVNIQHCDLVGQGNNYSRSCKVFVSSLLQIFSFQSTWAECRRITHSWTQTPSSLCFGVCTRSTDAPRWRSTICQRTVWVHHGVLLCLHAYSTCCALAELMRALEKHYFLSENLLSQPFLKSQDWFITRSQEPMNGPHLGPPESSPCPVSCLF